MNSELCASRQVLFNWATAKFSVSFDFSVCSIVGYGLITVFYHCNIAVCLSFLQMSVYFSSVVGRYMLTTVTVDDLILLPLCKVFFASFYSF